MMSQELPNLVDERRFRRRDTEQVERDEFGRVLGPLLSYEHANMTSVNGLKSAFRSTWRTCLASTSVLKSSVKAAPMSNTFKPRLAAEYRSKDEAAASWSTRPVKNRMSPCISMSPVRSQRKYSKRKSCAKIYSPVFGRTTSASRLTHLRSAWNLIQMAMVLTPVEVTTHPTVEVAATISRATTATLKPPTSLPTLHHLLQAQLLHQLCLQRTRRLPTTMLNTMQVNLVVILMRRTEATRTTWHTISSTTNKHSSRLLHRQLREAIPLLHLRLRPGSECAVSKNVQCLCVRRRRHVQCVDSC